MRLLLTGGGRGTLKNRSFVKNSHSLQELEVEIRNKVANVSRQEILFVSRNVPRICVACLEAGGRHFETLL